MLGGQPSHDWQLCFPLLLHAGGSGFGLKDMSVSGMVGAGTLAVVKPIGVGLLNVFCSGVLIYVLLGP